jgi:hypothetical protein
MQNPICASPFFGVLASDVRHGVSNGKLNQCSKAENAVRGSSIKEEEANDRQDEPNSHI